ncbi:Plant transposon protein [Seminavis robusta]|uniref:Plant transposon protein n=1 Tax=Seminavis robusta TaxID=568900 RepID=A0A9N8EER0_9STRA|nr:Plant transposon protein [Seminavis robusta]|eukprot:Sro885_g216130.1 Plant transposon protein (569) ;mRNA; f:32891-34597
MHADDTSSNNNNDGVDKALLLYSLALLEESGKASSIADCLDGDGLLNLDKLREVGEGEDAIREALSSLASALEREQQRKASRSVTTGSQGTKKTRKPRSTKSHRPYYLGDDGTVIYLTPKETVWYLLYVRNPPKEDPIFLRRFRRRFRLPHSAFLELVEKTSVSGKFRRWHRKDAMGQDCSPIELMILGALRYLGRGLTFDDLEEFTAINEETHRQFFHVFIEFGSTNLFQKYVSHPVNAEQYRTHQHEFNMGGLHGAAWSSDATNVIMWRCTHNLKQANTGFKQSHPARSYNLTCNHRRQILHTTKGHPSRWNDKTLAYHDEFLYSLRKGDILQDAKFTLLSWTAQVGGPVKESQYCGSWGLVDNGYHRWSCTQAPGKADLTLAERRLSEFIESFRKDVECTFGILKGRFRILKTGIRLEGTQSADNTWLTCCALHNWLLDIDGLSSEWQKGIRSDWEGELGDNEADGFAEYAPFAVQRLQQPEIAQFGSREHERSVARPRLLVPEVSMEDNDAGAEDDTSEGCGDSVNEDGAIYINSLSYREFRNLLVEHFDILWRRRAIVWPTKN